MGWPNDEAYYVIRDAGAGISSAVGVSLGRSCDASLVSFLGLSKVSEQGGNETLFLWRLKHVLRYVMVPSNANPAVGLVSAI